MKGGLDSNIIYKPLISGILDHILDRESELSIKQVDSLKEIRKSSRIKITTADKSEYEPEDKSEYQTEDQSADKAADKAADQREDQTEDKTSDKAADKSADKAIDTDRVITKLKRKCNLLQ